jgi:hypothetical protein
MRRTRREDRKRKRQEKKEWKKEKSMWELSNRGEENKLLFTLLQIADMRRMKDRFYRR